MRVFLVETDPISADSVAFFLEREGFEVESFFDAEEALQAMINTPPALVITEIILSGMNGLRLCEEVKSNSLTAHLPVVVLSVLQAEGRAQAAGADAFLLKPVHKTVLLDTVWQVLDQSQGAA